MAGALPGGGVGGLRNPGGGGSRRQPTFTGTNPGNAIRDRPQDPGHGTSPRPTARQLQNMLKNRGYKLAVDGQWGPISQSAMKAYRRGISAKRWNGNHPNSLNRAIVRQNAGGGSGRGRGGGGGGGGGGGRGRGRGGRGMKMPAMVKPVAAAHSAVNSQYDPLLAQLRSQRDLTQSQGRQNLADIGSYYDQLANVIGQQQTAGDTFATGAMGQQANDQQALLAALGGSANQAGPEAANFMQLMHGALQGQLNAQHDYMGNQATLAAQGRAQALTDQQRLTQQEVQGLNQQLSSQTAAKGAAYTKALSDAQQQKLQQMAAEQNMQIAAGQFGLSMAQGNAQLRNMQLQNKQLKNPNSFRQLTANDRAKLVEGVNSQMYNAGSGEPTYRPNEAWVRAANHLRALGYDVKTMPRVRAWLSHSWLNYVQDYNQAHPKNKYKPNGNGTPFTNQQWNH